MPLNIGDALETGIERSVSRVALTFAAIVFVLQAIEQLAASTVFANQVRAGLYPQDTPVHYFYPGPALPIGLPAVGVLTTVVGLLLVFVAIALFRGLESDADAVTSDLFTRRWLGALVHFVLLVILFALVALVNVIPVLGWIVFVYLVVALYFAPIRIAVADEGVITALKSSWELTRDNRLRLFALGVVFVVVLFVGFLVGLLLGVVPVVGFLLKALVNAYFVVLNAAVAVAAYDQLVDGRDAAGESTTQGGSDDGDDDQNRTPEPTAVGH